MMGNQDAEKGAFILIFFCAFICYFGFFSSEKSTNTPKDQFFSSHQEVAILEEDADLQELIKRQARSFSSAFVSFFDVIGSQKIRNNPRKNRHLSLGFN